MGAPGEVEEASVWLKKSTCAEEIHGRQGSYLSLADFCITEGVGAPGEDSVETEWLKKSTCAVPRRARI